jgi:IS5 family transposase
MTLGALTIKARLGLTDEELVEQIKENPYLQFFIGLEAFQYSAPFDPSMMVYFRKRLPESVINDCNKQIVRHSLNLIRSSAESVRMTTEITMVRLTPSKRPPLAPRISQIRASCSLARLVFTLISASPLISHCSMRPGRWPRVTSTLGSKAFREPSILPETSRNRVFLVVVSATRPSTAVRQPWEVAEKKRHCISKIRNAIRQQLGHLKRYLANIDALIACGTCLLAGRRHGYQKLLVVSERVRQPTILYHADSRNILDRIVSLCQAEISPIVRGRARCNTEFGAKISISVTGDGFTDLDRLSFNPYHEGEDLKAQALAYRRRHGHDAKAIFAVQINRTRSNRRFCKKHGIRLSGPRLLGGLRVYGKTF